jgi:predicted AlkP superfamily phosphohydrolase/phosphomutase
MIDDVTGCKTVIIGLDGATFNTIQPLINQKDLPFFQRLMHEGSYGVVNSNLPINSASNWTSLFTGKNPGKHNIFDFLTYNNGSYQPKLITNQSLKSTLLWSIANRNHIQTILLNAPVASEAEPLNGIMVSGMLSASGKRYAFPETIATELNKQNYIVDSGFARNLNPETYFDQITKTLLKQELTFQKLIQKHPWQLAILTLNALGKAQHHFWHERDKVEALYIQLDGFLSNIFESLDNKTNFIVVSNHGFKPITKKFFVNEWLWELGLLNKLITIHQTRLTDVYDLIFKDAPNDQHFVTKFLAKTGITKDNIRSVMPVFIAELIKRLFPWKIKKYFPEEYLDIVWDKTKAYFISTNAQGININLKGREPNGIVEPGEEYEQLRNQIIAELYRLKDPYTFENVIEEIYRKEDLFQGDYLKAAPDIIFVSRKNDYFLDSGKRACRLFIGPSNDDYPVHAYHDPNGIFFIMGPDIKAGQKIGNINIFDITPTILRLFGIQLNEDFDGRVIHQIFKEYKDSSNHFHPYFIPQETTFPMIPDDYFESNYAFGTTTP